MAQGPRDFINPSEMFPNTLHFLEYAVTQFLQILFSTFPAGDEPRKYHWDSNDEETEIFIGGTNTKNLVTVNERPRIVVSRGPQNWNKTHINNMVGSQNLSLARQNFASIYSGSVGVSCFSRVELEADRLAEIVSTAVQAYQPFLRKVYGFTEIGSVQIGSRAIVMKDSEIESVVTPVLIKTQVTKNWKTNISDPVVLRKMLFSFTVQTNPGGTIITEG